MKRRKLLRAIKQIVRCIFACLYFPVFLVLIICMRIVQGIMILLYLGLGDWQRAKDMFNLIFKERHV